MGNNKDKLVDKAGGKEIDRVYVYFIKQSAFINSDRINKMVQDKKN